MKRKLGVIFLSCIMAASMMFTGCSLKKDDSVKENSDGLNVIATLFPQYDFARAVIGDKGTVTMLLPPGGESHTYEPTPSDIMKINKADLFLYTGDEMEPWAKKIVDSLDNKELDVVDLSSGITLDEEDEHHHEEEEEALGNSEGDDETASESDDHDHEFDPHIWTSPKNAEIMLETVLQEVVSKDPENASYYEENAAAYKAQIEEIDNEFRQVVQDGKRKKIIFGDRFALHYFTKEYGLDWDAAFDSCAEESEPSPKVLKDLINEINDENIPVVYYAELSTGKVAKTISDATGAEVVMFHSCHNVSKEDFDNGVTYVDLMKQNVEALRKGLN